MMKIRGSLAAIYRNIRQALEENKQAIENLTARLLDKETNIKTLQMVSKNVIDGVKYSDTDTFFCEACVYGKHQKIPFKSSNQEKYKTGYACGPMSASSVSSAKYFVLFKVRIVPVTEWSILSNISTMFEIVLKMSNVQNKFGHRVKFLRLGQWHRIFPSQS